jgi:hypothetical protein
MVLMYISCLLILVLKIAVEMEYVFLVGALVITGGMMMDAAVLIAITPYALLILTQSIHKNAIIAVQMDNVLMVLVYVMVIIWETIAV